MGTWLIFEDRFSPAVAQFMAVRLPVMSVVVEAPLRAWFGVLHLPVICQLAQEEVTVEIVEAKSLWTL